jgi:hypothetical protein
VGRLLRIFSVLFVFSIFSVSCFSQENSSKAGLGDNSVISKTIVQHRDISKYDDGGVFSCGILFSEGNCDYKKLRNTIWGCWIKKQRCFLILSSPSVDSGVSEYIFVEPNRTKKWTVVRRELGYHAVASDPEYEEKFFELPVVYSLSWSKKKGTKFLLFKNKKGKVVDKY